MLGAIKRALGVGGATAEACAGCDPAILAQCSAAEAGRVSPHSLHVFIKLAAPPGSDEKTTVSPMNSRRVTRPAPSNRCEKSTLRVGFC